MRVIYIGTKYNERGTALRDVHPDEIVMIVDMDRCIGCGACRLGCQAEHGDAFTAPVRRIGMCHINNTPTKLRALPTSCESCEYPCDYKSVSYWSVCPAEKTVSYQGALCDYCVDRVVKGLTAACATRCAMKCLHVGRAADIMFTLEEKRLRDMGEAEFKN